MKNFLDILVGSLSVFAGAFLVTIVCEPKKFLQYIWIPISVGSLITIGLLLSKILDRVDCSRKID